MAFPLCFNVKPGIERVQALADISRSALCCHSNKTRAPITNPPNNAPLEGIPTFPPSYIRFPAIVWECGEGQSNRHTDTNRRLWPMYISRRLRVTRNV